MNTRTSTAMRLAFERACLNQFGSLANKVRRCLHTKSGTTVRKQLWSVTRGRR